MEQPKKEVCTIRIMFPVQSDDEALEAKKKIAEVLSDVPDVNFQFSITNMPGR